MEVDDRGDQWRSRPEEGVRANPCAKELISVFGGHAREAKRTHAGKVRARAGRAG